MHIKDTGSNYQFYEKLDNASIPRSVFDLSYINTFTAKEGQLIPYFTQYTLMQEDYTRKVECLAEVVNPPTVPLMNRQRIFFHEYWLSFNQLWKKAQIVFTKGYTDNMYESASEIVLPTIKLKKWKRGSLADMLGFNFVRADGDGYYICNALKFMAYLRIYRDMYMNKRIFCRYLESAINGDYTIANPLYGETGHDNVNLTTTQIQKIYNFMFPLDEADFRIDTAQWNDLKNDDEIIQYLFGEMKYRDYIDDYFTTATLEPMFGEVPTILGTVLGDTIFQRVQGVGGTNGKSNLSTITGLLGYGIAPFGTGTQKQLGLFDRGNAEKYFSVNAGTGQQNYNSYFGNGVESTDQTNKIRLGRNGSYQDGTLTGGSIPEQVTSAKYDDFIEAFNNTMQLKVKDLATSFTIDQIRNAESATLILEKLAKTDGSYSEYAKVMFGENPKSAYDYKPTYIGGTYQPIKYAQVIATSGTNENILGEIKGSGLSSGEGNIGKFHSDDYGVIIGVMSIMPDTYYKQGLNREDTYRTAEDFYLPDRASLGKQAILNKELYNDPQDIDNEDIFAWQNRFDELRYRANEVHGDIADDTKLYAKPYIQTRNFTSRPTLSPEFLTTEGNIDDDWLSVSESNMKPFIIQIGNNTKAVRPLPYRAEPATFGM